MVIYMAEFWEECSACGRVSMTKEEYNIHFEQVEWEEMEDRFRDRNMYGERGENVYQIQELPLPSRQATLEELGVFN
jgi:hypothetical protein